jgi:hypothetical protein
MLLRRNTRRAQVLRGVTAVAPCNIGSLTGDWATLRAEYDFDKVWHVPVSADGWRVHLQCLVPRI